MLLNGQSLSSWFDEDEFHCLVSPAVAPQADDSNSVFLERAVVQAAYQGTYFTVEVPITVRDIDCDVIIGRESIALFHLVVSQPDGVETLSRGSLSPSHLEESSYDQFPVDGSGDGSLSAVFGREDTHHAELGMEEIRSHTVRTLENALGPDGTQFCERQFFMTVLEERAMCRLHSVIAREGSDLGDALLRYLFTGACGLWQDEGGHVACGDICCGLQGPSEIVSTWISIDGMII